MESINNIRNKIARIGHTAVVYNGKMYVFGGNDGTTTNSGKKNDV